LSSRKANGTETTRYAPWVKLSNTILTKLREEAVSRDLGEILGPLPDLNGSTLVFQRNDEQVICSEHMGIDDHCVAKGACRKPDVTGLTISRALRTTQQGVPKTPDFTWERAWKEHVEGSAQGTPHKAPNRNNVLIDVVFRIKRKNAMEPIRRTYDSTTLKDDIKPLRLVEDSEEQFDLESRSRKRPREDDGPAATNSKKLKINAAGGSIESGGGAKSSQVGSYPSHPSPADPTPSSTLPPALQLTVYAGKRLSSNLTLHHAIESVVIGTFSPLKKPVAAILMLQPHRRRRVDVVV
jgi:hypothetical protein